MRIEKAAFLYPREKLFSCVRLRRLLWQRIRNQSITLQQRSPIHQANRAYRNTYEIVLADAIARYKRSQGYDVFFRPEQTSKDRRSSSSGRGRRYAEGICGQCSSEIKRIWDLMDTSYDKFIRTTDEDHERQVQKIFKKLYEQGDIYKGYYEGRTVRRASHFSQNPSSWTASARTAAVKCSRRRRSIFLQK